MLPEEIASELGQKAFCIDRAFLSTEQLKDLGDDFDRAHAGGEFRRAGTGQGEDNELREQVRRDSVRWWDRADDNSVQKHLWERFDSLRQAFNRTLFLGITDFEGHYAAYPAGGFYRRHLDCFQRDQGRIVSVVIYLTRDWKREDGGQLRLYGEYGHTDVDPVGGTLVCFLSRELEHEVLLSHAPRSSFAGWFKVERPG